MEKIYKHGTECAVNMYLSKYQVLQQVELELFSKVQKVFTNESPCNLYFILKRPRISLDPNYRHADNSSIELKYYIHERDIRHERKLRIKTETPHNIEVTSEYPYNYITLLNKNGSNRHDKLAVVVDAIHKKSDTIEPLLDYEVLYIGQAYGEDGQRTAIERLPSHSTLQKIYSEASHRNPDSEIWIMLATFSQKNITTMNGRVPIVNEKNDEQRFLNFINVDNTKFSEKQRINFTEAALIKTFLPLYNKEYKNSFPNPAHSSYSQCYDFDLNAIVVETDMTEARRWLYTEDKPRNKDKIQYWQHGLFYFVTSEDRYKMFNHEYL